MRLDPAYAKGHYRKGQAFMALSRPAEAAEAFRAGAALEPESKLWAPLVAKAAKAVEAAATAAAAAPATAVATPNGVKVSSRKAVASGGTSAAPPASRDPSSSTGGGGDGVAETGATGAGMKGYKKTADGRMTTYFNNDLTEEAKALIGDIAPKKVEATAADAESGSAGNDVSVWNKAGTWESRDMTRYVGPCFSRTSRDDVVNGLCRWIVLARGRLRIVCCQRVATKVSHGEIPTPGIVHVGEGCAAVFFLVVGSRNVGASNARVSKIFVGTMGKATKQGFNLWRRASLERVAFFLPLGSFACIPFSWAKQRLNELLLEVEFYAEEGSVEVVKVEKLEGDAEV